MSARPRFLHTVDGVPATFRQRGVRASLDDSAATITLVQSKAQLRREQAACLAWLRASEPHVDLRRERRRYGFVAVVA